MTSEVQRQEAAAAIVMAKAFSKRKEVTLMKTRLLRKCRSSGSDTMLEIRNNCIIFFFPIKEYTSVPLYRRHMCAVQGCGTSTVRYKCAVQVLYK